AVLFPDVAGADTDDSSAGLLSSSQRRAGRAPQRIGGRRRGCLSAASSAPPRAARSAGNRCGFIASARVPVACSLVTFLHAQESDSVLAQQEGKPLPLLLPIRRDKHQIRNKSFHSPPGSELLFFARAKKSQPKETRPDATRS